MFVILSFIVFLHTKLHRKHFIINSGQLGSESANKRICVAALPHAHQSYKFFLSQEKLNYFEAIKLRYFKNK